MAQVWKIRLPDGRVLTPGEWSSTPLYSTVEIGTGPQAPLPAFSYGIGGPVPGSIGPRKSDLRDTNLDGQGAILAENEELLCFSAHIELFQIGDTAGTEDLTQIPSVSTLNVLRLQRDVLSILRISSKRTEYARAPMGFFPAAMGVVSTYGPDANTGAFVGNNGGASVRNRREFATPHHVAPGEAFEWSFEFPFGQVLNLNLDAQNGRIRAITYLDGYRRRPVA